MSTGQNGSVSGKITRRGFVKGATAIGAGAAALSLIRPTLAETQTNEKVAKRRSRTPAKMLPARTQPTVIPADTGARALVEATTALGLNYWLLNPGTDWPALIDAMAGMIGSGESPAPRVMPVPHENVATEMAGGYAIVSGKPAIIGYHVIVGPANALAHIENLFTAQIPAIIIDGKRSWTETGYLLSDQGPQGQDTYDQGGLLRPFVKYDYEFKTIDQIPEVLARATQIAMTDPKGPVYLMLPCELGAMPTTSVTIQPQELFTPSAPAAPDPVCIGQAAELLANAQNPVIFTGGGTTGPGIGRIPAAVPLLVELAEQLAIPVSPALGAYLNFPTNHPMATTIPLSKADVIMYIDAPAPWSTASAGIVPNASAKYISVASEPLFVDSYPFDAFYPADVRITARPDLALSAILQQTTDILSTSPSLQSSIQERYATLAAASAKAAQTAIATAQGYSNTTPINDSWFGYCVSQIIDSNTIYVNEIGPPTSTFALTQPGTYMGNMPSATLGAGLGQALGAKLASPQSTVIAAVGDGSYMYGVPGVAFFAAAKHNLPFLALVDANTCWRAVKSALLTAYPKGHAVTYGLSDLGTDLYLGPLGSGAAGTTASPPPHYEMECEASGGYGEMVTDPTVLPAALQRGLTAVKNGQAACLNVVTSHPGP